MERYSWAYDNDVLKHASITINPHDNKIAVLVILDGVDTCGINIGLEEANEIYNLLGKALGDKNE
jgi:hypothetical protein